MDSCRYIPPDPLSAFVKFLWYCESSRQPHARERLMPNGETSIIFNLRDDSIRLFDPHDLDRHISYGHSVVSGPRTGCFVIDTDQTQRVFGIQFEPGGAFPFFRLPACELENSAVALECLWRAAAGELRERLLAAPSVKAMFTLAQDYLLAQLVRPLQLHPAVNFARQQFCRVLDAPSVSSVRGQTGLSHRRFVELFHQQIGLTPKSFYRVRRFQQVLHSVHGLSDVDWATVALECGYYDQPHFIHDFREFSGLTPAQYLQRATAHLNHVPMD